MPRLISFSVLIFFQTIRLFGQPGANLSSKELIEINGVIYTNDNRLNAVDSSVIILINSRNIIESATQTDSNGHYRLKCLKQENYQVKLNCYGYFDTIHLLKTHLKDSIVDFGIRKCREKNLLGICQKCGTNEYVASNRHGFYIYDRFFNSKFQEKRHYRRVKRQGYELDKFSEKKVVVWIYRVSKETTYKPGERCSSWFCTKHLIAF
jgi:hypothetical protein